ncbi:MAG TPA: hypothetical protein VGQ55_04655 [Pyrinomonadaceae bacterium]|nr:hypothetical protein [Pyrinomonadaceae bacterium]
MKSFFLSIVVMTAGSLSLAAQGAKPSVVTGDVSTVSAEKIVLQTKDGAVDVTISDKTEFKRVPPENPVLKAAVASAVKEIGEGDKLLVTGFFSDDKKTLPARSVYLMTKSSIAERHQKESQEWATRGISGKIVKIDQATKQIGVEVRGLGSSTTVMISPKDGAKYLRYAPNSVKFSEAKTSNILEIQPGDMMRALGDRSADGASFAAEEIVTGAFQTMAGTVKTIDAAKNEVVITDLQTKKDVTVDLSLATTLKKFPAEMAQRLAQFQGGGGMMRLGGGAASGRPQGTPPANAQGGQGAPGGPGRGGFGGRGGVDEMLERFPNITAADLKAGDVIAVSSSKNGTPERIVAIKLLAGVEPFLAAAAAAQAASGRPQSAQSLNIPGLDSLSFP